MTKFSKLRYSGLGAKSVGFVALNNRQGGPAVDVQGLRKLDTQGFVLPGWSVVEAVQEEISMIRQVIAPGMLGQDGVTERYRGTRLLVWGTLACLLVCAGMVATTQITSAQNPWTSMSAASDPRLACLDEDIKEGNIKEGNVEDNVSYGTNLMQPSGK